MILRPGDTYHGVLIINTSTGATDADVSVGNPLITIIADRNGTDDSAFTLSVTHKDTGRYAISGNVPSGYVAGDLVNLIGVAVIAGATYKNRVYPEIQIDSYRLADIVYKIGS